MDAEEILGYLLVFFVPGIGYSALVLLAASDFLAAISLVYRISSSLSNHIPSNNSRNLSEEHASHRVYLNPNSNCGALLIS